MKNKDIPSGRATANLLKSYYVDYRIAAKDTRLSFVMQAGQRSPELKRLYDETGTDTAAFLSAWNPDDEPDEGDVEFENKESHETLASEFEGMSDKVFEGTGKDGEPGFLVLGLTKKRANRLAGGYGHVAYLWAEADAVPAIETAQFQTYDPKKNRLVINIVMLALLGFVLYPIARYFLFHHPRVSKRVDGYEAIQKGDSAARVLELMGPADGAPISGTESAKVEGVWYPVVRYSISSKYPLTIYFDKDSKVVGKFMGKYTSAGPPAWRVFGGNPPPEK